MTKLYCPNGHENLSRLEEEVWGYDVQYCDGCDRPHFGIDCLNELHVNDMNAVETKVNPSDMQLVNPKRESQIAIDRVVEALEAMNREISNIDFMKFSTKLTLRDFQSGINAAIKELNK